MTAYKSTLLAALLAGATFGALPAFAQDAPPPAADRPAPEGDWPRFDLSRFDTNGDGKVSLEEIQQARNAQVGAVDANGDGKLSFDEMVEMELRAVRPSIEARVRARIEMQDADGDGLLSAAELATPPAHKRMFERLDANKDGVVTEEEIGAARERMRDRAERRGDWRGNHERRAEKRDESRAPGDRPGDHRPPRAPDEGTPPDAGEN